MAMYLEFVIPGPPISNQQSTPLGKTNLAAWRATIAAAAQTNNRLRERPPDPSRSPWQFFSHYTSARCRPTVPGAAVSQLIAARLSTVGSQR